jgi:hypothetical protein
VEFPVDVFRFDMAVKCRYRFHYTAQVLAKPCVNQCGELVSIRGASEIERDILFSQLERGLAARRLTAKI